MALCFCQYLQTSIKTVDGGAEDEANHGPETAEQGFAEHQANKEGNRTTIRFYPTVFEYYPLGSHGDD